MQKLDENRIRNLREAVANIGKPSDTKRKSLPLSSYYIPSEKTPKLDALEARIAAHELEHKNKVEDEIDADKVIAAIKGKFDISHIRNGENLAIVASKAANINMNDMRWHGGGLAEVAHDSTLTGLGTTASPLSVVSSPAVNQMYGEVPAGSGASFTLANPPVINTVRLYRGGARQQEGGDYTILGAAITFIIPLVLGEILLADYNY